MATFLDLGLLQHFQIIFTILFVFLIIFGMFSYYKPFGESYKGAYALIALTIAFFTLFSPTVVTTVSNLAPWFVLLFVFMTFLLIGYNLVGLTSGDIASHVKGSSAIKWTIFITGGVILIIALSTSVGPRLASGQVSTGSGPTLYDPNAPGVAENQEFAQNLATIFFHPKMLGMAFIMLLALSTVALLGSKGAR